MIKEFTSKETWRTDIERADADDVAFAVTYLPETDQIYIEFYGSAEISVVEVSMADLVGITNLFRQSVRKIKKGRR